MKYTIAMTTPETNNSKSPEIGKSINLGHIAATIGMAGAMAFTPISKALETSKALSILQNEASSAALVVQDMKAKVKTAEQAIPEAEKLAQQELEIRNKSAISEIEQQITEMKQRLSTIYDKYPPIKQYLEVDSVKNPKASLQIKSSDPDMTAAMTTALDLKQAMSNTQIRLGELTTQATTSSDRSVNDRITDIQMKEGSSGTTQELVRSMDGASESFRYAKAELAKAEDNLATTKSQLDPQIAELKASSDSAMLQGGIAGSAAAAGTSLILSSLKKRHCLTRIGNIKLVNHQV
jgi:chromosome segregation ATPase